MNKDELFWFVLLVCMGAINAVSIIDAIKLKSNSESAVCQKHFDSDYFNVTTERQKIISHKGIKRARITIECEVKK